MSLAEDLQEEVNEDEPKDRPFNPWRIPISDKSKAVVAEAVTMIMNYEKRFEVRKRKRRPDDQATFEATVSAVLCDLIHHHLTGKQGAVYITRSNQVLGRKSRYRSPVFGKTLRKILDLMETPEMAFVISEKGYQSDFGPAKRTTIQAGWRTLDRIEQHEIGLEDLAVSPRQEVIVLRREKEDYRDKKKKDIEYDDNSTTIRFRQQVVEINAWLASADIDFDESALVDQSRIVDVNDRSLRRIFSQSRFDRGGRLFGGFWQSLRKQERREGLIIDGYGVSELDYGQMNPRIVYGLCDAQPSQLDIYEIPGFEQHRGGIKRVMNAMLFSQKRLSRMPQGVRKEFDESHRVEDVMEAIERAHPAIRERFFTDVGYEAQFIESQILIEVLLTLKAEGIVALPIHDAILVRQDHEDRAMEVMLSAFHRHTGIDGLVSVEH